MQTFQVTRPLAQLLARFNVPVRCGTSSPALDLRTFTGKTVGDGRATQPEWRPLTHEEVAEIAAPLLSEKRPGNPILPNDIATMHVDLRHGGRHVVFTIRMDR